MSTAISPQEFEQLDRAGGTPFDIVDEPGRLGIAFNNGGALVKIWDLGAQGCVLETPANVAKAMEILAPRA